MRGSFGVGECNSRGDPLGEFFGREILCGCRWQDECPNLGATTAEDDGVSDVRGRAKSEFDWDWVGLFTIDLMWFRVVS